MVFYVRVATRGSAKDGTHPQALNTISDGHGARREPPTLTAEECKAAVRVGRIGHTLHSRSVSGEVLGLDWRDVDLANRRIYVGQQVHDGKPGPLKDDESRVFPILKALFPILAEWKLATGGVGLVFPPRFAARGGRPGTPPAFTRPNTLWRHLEKALDKCKLPNLTWYQATRHTFASQFILGGGSIEKLSKIMGHASVTTTERHPHLRTDLFRESDFDLVAVDLSTPGAHVVSLHPEAEKGTVGYATVTDSSAPPAKAALNT